ncbi:LysR substrate-binding domain-containing protein [Conexibacter arvalis]|uniref:DNA-binding transcriptional LysR family regulator n=1 Tax=Conexibacter arvalis TaxID=912552 RepID=A0A840IJB7_9ACTN|nr:LysR substrate-binding domain-containing protein [Conexibacter arvalis]MBB4665187.1 DNA-binding transcriptional LysR family regulator [Conexibacter arvalis]
MDVELRHLRYFVAVAEELSFTRAAERLHIAQPPLSTQIRNLEAALGVALFDRSRRQVALTDAGELLLGEARRLLTQIEQALNATRNAGTGETGRLTIGFVPSASTSTLPDHLRAFRARYPGVELFLRELPPDDLVAQLHGGALDLCFLYLPFDDERLRRVVVAREPLVAALPDDHRLAQDGGRRAGPADAADAGAGEAGAGEAGAGEAGDGAAAAAPVLRTADLRDEQFVLPARHHMPGLNARVIDACRRAGFEPQPVQRDVWLMQTVLGLVAAGIGVALVPSSVQRLNRAGVAFRPLDDAGEPVELGAFWRAEDTAPTLRNFVALLRS